MNKKTIYQKVAEVQQSIGSIAKDTVNSNFESRYFDINSLINKLQPILEQKGLMLLQPIEDNMVKSILINLEDGIQLTSEIELPYLENPQMIGSCITYYRRYTLQSLLALEAEDDDANVATTNTETSYSNKPWLNSIDYTTKETTPQWSAILREIEQNTITTIDQVRKRYKVSKKIEARLENLIENAAKPRAYDTTNI